MYVLILTLLYELVVCAACARVRTRGVVRTRGGVRVVRMGCVGGAHGMRGWCVCTAWCIGGMRAVELVFACACDAQ